MSNLNDKTFILLSDLMEEEKKNLEVLTKKKLELTPETEIYAQEIYLSELEELGYFEDLFDDNVDKVNRFKNIVTNNNLDQDVPLTYTYAALEDDNEVTGNLICTKEPEFIPLISMIIDKDKVLAFKLHV